MVFDAQLNKINKTYELFRLRRQLKKCHKLTIYFVNSVKLGEKTKDDKDELVLGLKKLKNNISDYIDSFTMFIETPDTVVVTKTTTEERKDNFIEQLLNTISDELLHGLQSYNNKNTHEIIKVCNSLAVDFYTLYKADMKNAYSTRNGLLWKSLDESLNKFNKMLKIKSVA
jgi:hypothetical protein